MSSNGHVTHDGIVAYFFLNQAWTVFADPLPAGRYERATRGLVLDLLKAAANAGVPQEHCDELLALLRSDPAGERSVALAVLVASEIPDDVVHKLTLKHLPDGEFDVTDYPLTEEEQGRLERLRAVSEFANVPRLH